MRATGDFIARRPSDHTFAFAAFQIAVDGSGRTNAFARPSLQDCGGLGRALLDRTPSLRHPQGPA
jgi:hypothetical protein